MLCMYCYTMEKKLDKILEIDKYLPGLKDKKIVEVLLLLKFHIHVLNAVFQFD